MSDGKLNNGVNPYRQGRPSKLEDPEYVRLVASMFADGWLRSRMAAELGVSEWTITQWRKDARVRAQWRRLTEDRILRITSRIDKVIDHRLAGSEDVDTDTLLKIRKEYLGGAFRNEAEGSAIDSETINKTMDSLEDAGVADGLRKLLATLENQRAEVSEEE
jgi:DNA-binding transcriptional regulator YdaS (Cro superfamily)